jgi:hypothetical protein
VRLIFLLALMILLSSTTPALAADAKDKAAEAPKEKKICRREEVIGSIIPKKTCRTQVEWTEMENINEANTRYILQHRRQQSTGQPL